MTKCIEDYALIGDCETAALVGRDGSVDWLCWPRFDSGALFASLLGDEDNGRWKLTAADEGAKITRAYRHNTLVLETLIETASGAAAVIDFLPPRHGGNSHLIRIVQGHRGWVEMTTELMLRFDYGLILPWITRIDGGVLKAISGPSMVVLRTEAPMEAQGYKHCGNFKIAAGETVSFVLSFGESFRPVPDPADPMKALEETERAWQRWSDRCSHGGRYGPPVLRSSRNS